MISFQNQVEIDRDAGDVFDFVADLENIPTWNYAIEGTTKVTDGPVGVGTKYRQHRTIPKPQQEELEIVDFHPADRLVVEGTLGPFDATLRYSFFEHGDSTRLVNEVDLTGRGPARLLAPIARGRIRSAVADNLKELKHRLEAR